MTRAVLAVMAGLLCAAAGLRGASDIRQTAERLRRWSNTLTRLELILSEGVYTLPESFQRTATEGGAPDKLLQALAQGLRREPMSSLPELYGRQAVPSPENEPLGRLMTRLMHGSLELRCQAVKEAAEEISLLARQARENADRDANMWRSLGLIGGACLTLMLL